jgi:hypothetical protein
VHHKVQKGVIQSTTLVRTLKDEVEKFKKAGGERANFDWSKFAADAKTKNAANKDTILTDTDIDRIVDGYKKKTYYLHGNENVALVLS